MFDHQSDESLTSPAPGAEASPRVDLILQQLDNLPTLSSVALRVIELTTADDSRADEVIRLISADPALAARVLKLSRSADRMRGKAVTTIDRAVVQLGFDAVRSAVLSVELFDFFEKLSAGGELTSDTAVFDRTMFWHHSLAVSVLAGELVNSTNLRRQVTNSEAAVTGLLHDLGLLALHVMLPKSVDRACQLAETRNISLAAACGRIIGLTSHTTGKRLAERWHLPRSLGDAMWLHGQPHASLPELPHRGLVTLITLSDIIARQRYLTPVGHGGRGERVIELCESLDLDPTIVDQAAAQLNDEVAQRADALGLDAQPDWDLVLRSISRANQALGRMNDELRTSATTAQRQTITLSAITAFQQSQSPGDSIMSVLEKVAQSAGDYLGGGFLAILLQRDVDQPWRLVQFTSDGYALREEIIHPPQGSGSLDDLDDQHRVSMKMLGLLPWLSDYLVDSCDLREIHLLPLRCGWGVSAVLLHDRELPGGDRCQQIDALSRTWASAIAAGGQHEGATALGEQLAEANRMLVDAQEELAERKALAAVGEIVAGAAHEMNNPLTIICGRAQQLMQQLDDAQSKDAAEQITEQSHRLSDMISALREFTEPARPQRETVALATLLEDTLQPLRAHGASITLDLPDDLPDAWLDPAQIGSAVRELVCNALESEGAPHIAVRVQIEPSDDRLRVQVRDDGAGLDSHALAHAFEPFFSSKPAGRQPGLGLARARRYVEAHHGSLTLESGPRGGATATIRLEQWRQEQHPATKAVA